ncbi:MAG TPA: glutamine amidotransferase [Gammaproteobacteria bacterium]|nr:glutamine amidotransferase [Gammaproteobacteria bacterium]
MNKKRAHVIRHVAFEDLGTFEEILKKNGYAIQYFEAGYDDLMVIYNSQPEMLIILGGPIGVYDHADYPFLKTETSILKIRIENDLPTLGICLGAQLIASALNSEVFNGGKKEIGWSGLNLTEEGKNNYFKYLDGSRTSVLHWHSDTFNLPSRARLQASTDIYDNQAFIYGKNVLALQFHPEITELGMEKWFIGHANEIASTDSVNVAQLRNDTKNYSHNLGQNSKMFFDEWISSLEK